MKNTKQFISMFLNLFSAAGGFYRWSATLKKGFSKTASNQLHLCAFSMYYLKFNWLRKPEHTDHNPAFYSELSVSNCTHTLSHPLLSSLICVVQIRSQAPAPLGFWPEKEVIITNCKQCFWKAWTTSSFPKEKVTLSKLALQIANLT